MKEKQECFNYEDAIKIVTYLLHVFWASAGLCYLSYSTNESITISLLVFISANLLATISAIHSLNNKKDDSEKKEENEEKQEK